MEVVRFWLFGVFRAASGGGQVLRAGSHKAQELLALLLLSPSASLSRDTVTEQLWPEADPAASRKAMRQALWHAHQSFDTAEGDDERLVVADEEQLGINPARRAWVDVDAYRAAVAPSEGTPADQLDANLLEDLTFGMQLYRQPLLEGWYEDWCIIERERLADLHMTALEKLSIAHELRGEHELAARWARELLIHEPAHERTHRRLMRLYYLTGDRTRALRQYQRCCSLLQDELGVKPAGRTEALAQTIRADGPVQPDPHQNGKASTVALSPEPTPPTPSIEDELAALRQEFEHLSRELRNQRA
ncbi:MAG TPA: bacterial transcriptional activator domain-containing protein [Nitriliruptorales bacterium]|nr:bacterial transcriptional activator domain-containing protein [Nitriliruptorales bacterium]